MASESTTNVTQSSAGNGRAKRLYFESPCAFTTQAANPPADNASPPKKIIPSQKAFTTVKEFVGLLHNNLQSFITTHRETAICKFFTFHYKDIEYQEIHATADYTPLN